MSLLLTDGTRVDAAQSAYGTVRDAQTLLPVPYAVVTIEETGAVTEADAHGEFVFASLRAGEFHLCAQRIGYKRTCGIVIRVGPEEFMAPIVLLAPQPLTSRGIEVIATRLDGTHHTAPTSEVITADEIEASGSSTAADALRLAPSVEVIRGGTSGTQASIRGSRPDAVLVLVDGVPLAPAGQAADLSSIPAATIERIEILKGPAAAYAGADALGGAILVTTRAPDSRMGGEAYGAVGSFGGDMTGAALSGVGIGSHRLRASWQNEFSRGDFPYHDTLYRMEALRENNWLHRQNYSLLGSGRIGAGWTWRGGASHSRTHAGTPGPLYELTPDASRRDRRELYSAAIERSTMTGSAAFSYARSQAWSYYDILGVQPKRAETDAMEEIWSANYERLCGTFSGAAVGAEYTQETLEGIDHRNTAYSFGAATRDNYALTLRYARDFKLRSDVLRNVRVGGGYRYNQSETEADYPKTAISPVIEPPQRVWRFWSPNASAGLYGALRSVSWNVSVAYGKAYKRAGLFDLFLDEAYLTRGNPGLKPERSEQTEIGYALGVQRKVSVEFGQQFFWSRYSDLIYWRLGAGRVWSPANIGRARIDGREDELRLHFFGSALAVELRHLFQDHRNTAGELNTDGQPLPFRYRHKTSVTLQSRWRGAYAEVSRRWYDRRYLREAGAVARSLDPYSATDLSAGLRVHRWGVAAELNCRVENIENTAYEVIERQPMPGRNYRLSIQIKR
jgi:outer membrane cobalamin receptor